MTAAELERYLHDHIPLSRAMQIAVVAADDAQVELAAPLAPNINHRDTVFGGSASAIAIFAAWSLVHTRLARSGRQARIVIQRNTMAYDEPVAGAFGARSAVDEAAWSAFVRTLDRKGRARIAISATLLDAGRAAGRFDGDFVALALDPH